MRNAVCHIVGAGEFHARHLLAKPPSEGDLVIAADGGLKWLSEAGLMPDIIVGDFDSHPRPACEHILLDREKDETDMNHAIRIGYRKGFRSFRIHGGTGGRPDHTYANIQCLVQLSRTGAAGLLYFKHYCMSALTGGGARISESQGGYVSVFAYGGRACGVTLTGLKYTLTDAVLNDDDPIGTSNELTGQAACIEVKRGTLLLTFPAESEICFTHRVPSILEL